MAKIIPVDNDEIIFTTWQGYMKSPQLQGGSDQRMGSGTVLAYVTSKRADHAVITVTVLTPSEETANAVAAAIENCKNRICDVTNDFERNFPVCLCHEATITRLREGKSANGMTHLIEATLELEVLEDQIAQNTIPGQ